MSTDNLIKDMSKSAILTEIVQNIDRDKIDTQLSPIIGGISVFVTVYSRNRADIGLVTEDSEIITSYDDVDLYAVLQLD